MCGQVMVDFHACQWPMANAHDTSLAEYFDNLNEPSLSNLQAAASRQLFSSCAFLTVQHNIHCRMPALLYSV